uniref:Uncharacterized protein LOC104226406 n=1 Tax=Nicotiana sylvestris TaxID=4096 RepID=A0A1U7WDH2_NICSY|nr:PREDICTED: uncharacterized protein LOC104226406 [Nicotiana sylvestris]
MASINTSSLRKHHDYQNTTSASMLWVLCQPLDGSNVQVPCASTMESMVKCASTMCKYHWPRPPKTDPAQRNPNQMCKYHGTHGHRIEDCRQLSEEVAHLFNEGHLREFLSDRAKNHFRDRDTNRKNDQEEPQHVIHMIVGGFDIPQVLTFKCTKVIITREKYTRDYLLEATLSFNNEDAEGIEHPHNDVLDQIEPAARVINGLNMASETTKWEIILLVNVAGTIQKMKFHMIEGDMRYNALLGSPWIHNMRAVPSTLHQVLKFLTSKGIKMMYGKQPVAKEMFAIDEVIPVSTLISTKGPESKKKQKVK